MPHRIQAIAESFLRSTLAEEGNYIQLSEILTWLNEQNEQVHVKVERIDFSDLVQWSFDREMDRLSHSSGKYFSIDGIRVQTDWGNIPQWEQPIIHQPEIGFLGFIATEIGGLLHLLVQAKIEPGNVNHVQLSPTLQATKSNYTQVHEGKKPLYLEYFLHAKPESILLDQLQSEQGGRFLKKRNRNIIIRVDDEIELPDNFLWLTLGQIKSLMHHDNLVNMDTRTVISGIPFGTFELGTQGGLNFLRVNPVTSKIGRLLFRSRLIAEGALHSVEDVISFLTSLKSRYELNVRRIPLTEVGDWEISSSQISHVDNKYFRVIAAEVQIGNREVTQWTQPMVEPAQEGLCAFVCKEINGVLHFAVQAKLECGNFDTIEFAPTVQCLTGNYRNTQGDSLPFLNYVLNASSEQCIYDALQSEEGGRFYREQNRNMIVLAGDEISNELPEKYIWMTLHQLSIFIKYNNYLNIQARSLIAAISFL